MDDYYAHVRELLLAAPTGARSSRSVYRTLLRRQQQQVLDRLFAPLEARLGAAQFAWLRDLLCARTPPRDANPSRWAVDVAYELSAAPTPIVDAHSRALALFLALRLEVYLAPDLSWREGLAPHARLAAFPCDPRVGLAAPSALEDSAPIVLAFYRDRDGCVHTAALSLAAVAAWGAASGEVDRDDLAARGVDRAQLKRGERELRGLGVLRGLRAADEA